MISCFPIPYPDETFDSLCYRYAVRMKYPNKSALGEDLFGKRIISIAVDAPLRLAYFIKRLPPGSQLTVSRIISEHTFLPYYQPFLRKRTYEDMIAQMTGEGYELNILGGLSKFRKHVPVYLRYCPACVSSDRQQYGECYWHRQHQLPGIKICPQHATWLEESSVYAKHPNFSQGPITAEEALSKIETTPREVKISRLTQILKRLSEDSRWIVNQNWDVKADITYRKYRVALRQKGYLTTRDKLYRDRFLNDFLDYYPSDLFQNLGYEFPRQPQKRLGWVSRLTGHYHRLNFSPLAHLLLIQFLGESASTLFTLPNEWRPFGDGPWPCLNRTCQHYRQPVITVSQIVYIKSRPRGKFQCECGFAYRRWGPDQTEDDRYAYDWVFTYGKVWDNRLRELWNDTEISVVAMRKMLGIGSSDTIKCHALRLGLKFEKHRDLAISTFVRPSRDGNSYDALRNRRITIRRQQILDMKEEKPDLTRRQLFAKAPTELEDIRRFDPKWLNNIAPKIIGASRGTMDWRGRDETLTERIPIVVKDIQSEPGKPIRITKAEIGRRAEIKNLLYNGLDKLPNTKAILEKVLESREDYAIRRVVWAKNHFLQNNELPNWWDFVRMAGVEKSLFSSVKAMIEVSLKEIAQAVDASVCSDDHDG